MAACCPECGARIPQGSPFGQCPQCLLGLGLDPPATITAGVDPEISSETESLLRGRLQVGVWMIMVGLALFVIRDLVYHPEQPRATVADWVDTFGVRALLVAFYAATVALLRSTRPLTLRQLRHLEVVILWAVALWFASDRLYFTRQAIFQQDAGDTLFAVAFSVMTYFALLSAYGFFSPNTWKRALGMTSLLALTPLGVLAVVGVTDADAVRFLLDSGTGSQISSMALMLAIGVMIATWGSHRIHTLRLEVFEAKRLGQYRLSERIGKGGMGEVWRADHRLLARPAAIKLIKPEMVGGGDPVAAHDFMRSFEREAQITAGLRSTHTVVLYDFGMTADGAFYYVMELLDGSDLHTLVKEFGPLDPARVANLLEQVCDSLAEAHEKGLVHRDIKPANIQVCRMGTRFDFVKVLDFGLARARSRRGGAKPGGESSIVVIGTPSYLAPEMATGGDVDARADIYSLGCVGYWLLTGRPVFRRQDERRARRHARRAINRVGFGARHTENPAGARGDCPFLPGKGSRTAPAECRRTGTAAARYRPGRIVDAGASASLVGGQRRRDLRAGPSLCEQCVRNRKQAG